MLNERKFDVVEEDGSVRKGVRFRPDVIETQLSHLVGRDKLRAVYNQAEYLDERTEMMLAWANWLDTCAEGVRREGVPRHEARSTPGPLLSS